MNPINNHFGYIIHHKNFSPNGFNKNIDISSEYKDSILLDEIMRQMGQIDCYGDCCPNRKIFKF